MWQVLRIISTILCAICLAIIIPVAVHGGLPGVFFVTLIGGALFLFMLFCKRKQEGEVETENPPDFLSPKTDDEQEKEE